MSESSPRIETTQSVVVTDAAIYVREDNPQTARETAQNIYRLLASYQGKVASGADNVPFLRILITNPPRYWGYNENTKATEFILTISCRHIDNDLTNFN
jgi:hypothetical protein